jgi:NAD(P)-dependent dehydrogenase (short-subunit alcohol dehydrogenase family)
MSERRLLVTGACGCIGAWVVHELVGAGEDVVTFDLSTDRRRLAVLLEPEELERMPHVAGDISDVNAVERGPRRARDHERHPSRRVPGALLPGRPAAGRTGQLRRHRQRLRGRPAPARPDRARRARVLDRGVRRP